MEHQSRHVNIKRDLWNVYVEWFVRDGWLLYKTDRTSSLHHLVIHIHKQPSDLNQSCLPILSYTYRFMLGPQFGVGYIDVQNS